MFNFQMCEESETESEKENTSNYDDHDRENGVKRSNGLLDSLFDV